jgi:hypothetical protein
MPFSGDGDYVDFFGGTRRRQRSRLARATPSVVCVLGAVVLMAMIGGSDVDQGNLYAIPAATLAWTAVTFPVWYRGVARSQAEGRARRVLRLHRRVHLRVGLVLLYASAVLLWMASYAHFEGSDEYSTTSNSADTAHYNTYSGWSLWLFLAALLVVLMTPLTWRLRPRSVRMAAREALLSARQDRIAARTPGYPLR